MLTTEQMKINIDTDVLSNLATGVKTAYTAAEGGTTVNSGNQGDKAGRKSADINLGATATPLVLAPRAPTAGHRARRARAHR